MLGYYLWLIPCFQIALINAAGVENEHIHIKVHVPDVSRSKQTQSYRMHQHHKQQQQPILQQIHYSGKRPLHTTIASHQHSSPSPYEFEFFGLGEAGGGHGSRTKSLMPEELMDSTNSYGPVLFNSNDIATSTVNGQHPVMSKQLMRQLFTPEMMSMITGREEDTSSQEMNDVNSHLNGMDFTNSMGSRPDMLSEYLQQFNRQQAQITAPTFSTKISNKRKKYAYAVEDEQKDQADSLEFQPYYSTSITQYLNPQKQQQQQHQHYQQEQFQYPKRAREPPEQQQQQRKQQIRQSPSNQRYQQRHQKYNPLQWGFEDDSDEFETAEDISSSASLDSNEDMTTAFNKLQPISYQDMYGAYATPLTSTASQHSLSYQQLTTEPTYSNDWRQYHQQAQYHHQRPEIQKQQQQQQQQQIQPKPQQQRYKQKQKSLQTQFVLPSTTLRLTTSSSSKSPISNGLTGGTLPWTLPYEFVQKSQQQQQKQQQKLEAQKYKQQQQYKQQKTSSRKKRKNRNKRKRTRIFVE